jgi:hypothetical protein
MAEARRSAAKPFSPRLGIIFGATRGARITLPKSLLLHDSSSFEVVSDVLERALKV